MKIKHLAVVAMFPGLLASVACQGKKKSSGTPFSAGNLVGSEKGISHVNEHYRFSIQGLGPEWRLLEQKEREGLLPDAAAVANRVGGAFGAVIVERFEGSDLNAFSEMIRTNMATATMGFEPGETREVDFNGGKAMRQSMKGTFNDVLFDYELMTFLHQGMGYQVLAWKPEEKGPRESLEEFIGSVSIEEGLVKIPPPPAAPDSTGVGNRIRDGRFESAVSGLSVTPVNDWGLMWGQGLVRTGEDAETGIQRLDQGIYISVSHQPVSEDQRQRFLDAVKGDIYENAQPAGKGSWTFAGEPIECVGVIIPGRPATRIYTGHLVRGNRGYRVKAWHIEQDGVDRSAAIAEGMELFKFLDAKSMADLRGLLEVEADLHGSVGEHYSLRSGVYRAFADGIVWKRPAGFWQVDVGDAARLRNEASSLHAIEMESGVTVQLVVEDASSLEPQPYHDAVVSLMEDGGFAPTGKKLDPVTVDGHEVLRSSLIYEGVDADIEYHVNTTVVGDKAYQLNCFAPTASMTASEELAGKALAGFSFPGKKLRSVESRGGRHRDVRMGFEFQPGSDMTAVPQKGRELLAKFGSCIEFRGKSGMISHLAVQAGGSGNDASIASNMVTQIFKLNLDRADSAGSSERKDMIGGVPATVRSGESDGSHLRIIVFRQGGVLHMGVLVGSSERKAEALLTDYKAGFSLIP